MLAHLQLLLLAHEVLVEEGVHLRNGQFCVVVLLVHAAS